MKFDNGPSNYVHKIVAVILAAGYSSRMQIFKPLLPLGKMTIVERLISVFQQNNVDVTVVGGHRFQELKAAISGYHVSMIENKEFARGMFNSIQTGTGSLPEGCQAVFIAPVDIPLIRPATVRRLIQAAKTNPDRIIYPTFNQRRGHPPLLPAGLISRIAESSSETNLKQILQENEILAVDIPVADRHILFDIDNPEDYTELLERYKRYEIPSEEERLVIIEDILKLKPDLKRHMARVAEVTSRICRALIAGGVTLDEETAAAAAGLHDIAKGQENHESAGAAYLEEMGFSRISQSIRLHTDLPGNLKEIPLEAQVVYLADKYTSGDKIVPLEKRYQTALEKYGGNPESRASILKRLNRAQKVREEIEQFSGISLNTLLLNSAD